jgi:hypothetical protein
MTTILGCCAWWVGGLLVLVGLWTALRLGWAAHHRPAPAPRVNQDVLAPSAPIYGARRLAVRPVPPVVTPERAAHDDLVRNLFGPEYVIVARPNGPLGWDAQPRKEYDL